MAIRLIILVIVLACIFGIYTAIITAEELPTKQAQEAALTRYGAALLALCKNASQTDRGSLQANARLAVINGANNGLFEPYQSGLPAAMRSADKSDVTTLLCLTEDKIVFDTAQYGKPAKYTCTQYERDLLAFLIDVKTGKTLAYKRIDGGEPPECPDKTDINLDRTGQLPSVTDINQWIADRIKGQL